MANAPQPGPENINWRALSPAASETLGQVAMRLAAGWDLYEVADELDRLRPPLKHLTLPTGRVTQGLVAARMRELRIEIRASVDAD